jgi:DNA-binding beta-propeller fold protein YncE
MMEKIIFVRYLTKVKILFLLLALQIFLLGNAVFTFAETKTTIATGLNAAAGLALDDSKNHLYFVEYGAGTLKRIDLSSPSLTIDLIASGFSHPEDVELDLEHGFAYVTTRDLPGTGALWKVDISTGSKTLITFNLGAPQQLVLVIANNQAFTVGYNEGRLRRIDLTTGVKIPIIKGLAHPVGLTITADGNYAYVTEQDAPARVSKIDLTMGVKIGSVVEHGTGGVSLVAPFFMAWTDITQNSLYVVERDPVNRVSRIDLITSAKHEVITGLPWRPSGIAVNKQGTTVYVSTDSQIVKVDLVELVGPIFMGVGHVPSTKISDDGYAETDPGYFFKVKHSPFGGNLNFFGNLTNFKNLQATHYEIWVSKDGGASEPLNLSWNTYKWNTATHEYELVPIAPEAGTTKYEIAQESDWNYHPELWYPPFFFMRWPSGENGLYEFQVKIYKKNGTIWDDFTYKLNAADNTLKLRIDNTPPEVKIESIWQGIPGDSIPDNEIKACDIISSPPNKYYFKITAYDPNHHLLSYHLTALWGDNKSEAPKNAYDSYVPHHVDPTPPHSWSGIINFIVPRDAPGSGGNPEAWEAKCNCAHTFYLRVWKRTINGYNYILHGKYHKSITINNSGIACQKP